MATSCPTLNWQEFLSSRPPGTQCYLPVGVPGLPSLPDIELYCDTCEGERNFSPNERVAHLNSTTWSFTYFHYTCRNCAKQPQAFAVLGTWRDSQVEVLKVGQFPSYGPKVPPRLRSLVGRDQEM